jgi:hypothetical protein
MQEFYGSDNVVELTRGKAVFGQIFRASEGLSNRRTFCDAALSLLGYRRYGPNAAGYAAPHGMIFYPFHQLSEDQ